MKEKILVDDVSWRIIFSHNYMASYRIMLQCKSCQCRTWGRKPFTSEVDTLNRTHFYNCKKRSDLPPEKLINKFLTLKLIESV